MAIVPVNRRHFLHTSGTLLGAACGVVPWELSAAETSQRLDQIIDTHTHFYDPTRAEGVPWPGKEDAVLYRPVLPAEFMKLAAPYGVTGTVIVEASSWLEDNQWLLDLAQDNPCVLGIVGNLQVVKPDFPKHLARFAKNPLFKGIRVNTPFAKLGPPADFVSHMRVLAESGLIVDFNGAAAGFPEILALKKQIPQLRLVVEHLPRTPSASPEQREVDTDALAELAQLPDVYGKVSYVLKAGIPDVSLQLADYRGELDDLWKTFGPDRLFYGSNWPVSDRVCPYGTIIGVMKEYMAGRSQEDAEKYFWKNARVAYQLKSTLP